MIAGNNVRLGLVGCGNFADCLAAALEQSRKADLITCYDISPERRRAFSTAYQCEEEKSYEDLLARDDIDGVLLVTPNVEHTPQAIQAARHKKHVFIEKPIANTIAEGKQIIAACENAGVILMVGHLRRRSAGNRKVKELIDGGAIGDPVMVEANVSGDSGFNLTPDKFRWCGDDSGCPGGMLMTSGIHHVDCFNYFFGPIKSVSAIFKKLYIPADVEDVNMTIFQFESGLPGYLGSTYASPYGNWMSVSGTKAKLLWAVSLPVPPTGKYLHNQDRYTRLTLFEKNKEARPIPFEFGDPVLEEMDEFAHCIRTGERPETDGQGALQALAFVRAAIDSARSGKIVQLSA